MKAMCGGALWLAAGSLAQAAEPKPAKAPFRLIFTAYDGDPKVDKPEQMVFQINTADLRQPSEFIRLGGMIPNTLFKLSKFEYKQRLNPGFGGRGDLSELTIVHKDTGQTAVLVFNMVTNVAELLQPPPKAPK